MKMQQKNTQMHVKSMAETVQRERERSSVALCERTNAMSPHASVLLSTARKRQTTMQTKTSPRICVENHCKMTFHRLWSIS